jgi:hypothetical protein
LNVWGSVIQSNLAALQTRTCQELPMLLFRVAGVALTSKLEDCIRAMRLDVLTKLELPCGPKSPIPAPNFQDAFRNMDITKPEMDLLNRLLQLANALGCVNLSPVIASKRARF